METAGPATAKSASFGALLKRYRMAAGLSQEELAERARLSTQAISALERGLRQAPYRDTVDLLVQALGLSAREAATLEATVPRRRGSLVVPAQSAPHPPEHPASPAPVASPARGGVPSPLVGRVHELGLVDRHLAGEGHPVLLLAGEPGIGKSRLLREAAQRATALGWQVLAGGCQRRSGHEPFSPVLEALDGYIECRSQVELRADLRGCAWLVRLLPELAAGPIEPLPAWTLPPEQERRLMDKAAARFLANVAGPAGTLLALDDLQWAGTDALALLAMLVRTAMEPPVYVIGTYRDTEVQPHDPLAVVLADLAHAALARQHTLAPLEPEEARQLLGALLDGWTEDAAAVRERVVQRAGGVPFFLVSYAQGLRRDTPESPTADTVPWHVAQGIRQRVATLPVAAREMLGAAALIGRLVPVPLLTVVAEQGERDVLAALEMAGRARLLIEEDYAYQFAHDLIREVVEADLSLARRQVLHRRVADALEQEPGEPVAELLAYHYDRAGVAEKAVMYLEQAGDRAWRRHANAAADAYFTGVVDRLDRLGRPQDAARAREKLGLVQHTATQHELALATLEHAAETYRARGDLESLGRVTAQIGLVYQDIGGQGDAVARLQVLAERLETSGPSKGLVRLYAVMSDLLVWWSGRYQEGLLTSERAVELARELGNAQILAEALATKGLALLAVGRLAEARQALEEAIPLAEATGDLVESLPKALWLLSIVFLRYGDLDRSASYCEQELVVTKQTGHAIRTAAATALRGIIAYVSGDWARARRHGEQALALSRQTRSWASAFPLTMLGLVYYGEGHWEDAARYLEESLAEGTRMGQLPALDFAPCVLAERDLREGHSEGARARLAPLLAAADQNSADVALLRPFYAWALLELGNVAEALAIVQQAGNQARVRNDRLALVDVLRVHALVELRQGHWASAKQALEEGITLARAIPYPYAEARLLHLHGQLHSQNHESEAARERLGAALAIFRRLGAHWDSEQVERDLAACASA